MQRPVPWAAPHMMGALSTRLPDVSSSEATPIKLFNSWASLAVHDLQDDVTLSSTRPLFDLPQRNVDREQEINGSLKHRTLSARVRFVDYVHEYTEAFKGKRSANGQAVKQRITRTRKDVRRSFNLTSGAARFVYNKALEFIRSLPQAEQTKMFNHNRLCQILLTVREYKKRAVRTQKENETDDDYAAYCLKKEASLTRNAAAKEAYADMNLIARFPWLKNVNANVLQQAVKCLVDAFHANLEKAKKARANGRSASRFKMRFKKRSTPSGWTFTLPSQLIRAEHVERPSNGKAVRGQQQPQPQPRTWTKLTLPSNLGGNNAGAGAYASFGGVVYLTQKVDISDGKLLADVDFTRDRLGRWHAHWQRAPLVRPAVKPLVKRKTAFFDPGSRTGNTVYLPDAKQVAELMAGDGGATRIFELCLKTDKLIEEQRNLGNPHSQQFKNLKRREHFLRTKVYNLVRDGHVRTAAYIWSKVDTAVVPIFDTHRMARKPMSQDDPRRRINNKTVRQLFSLRHGGLRDRLRHSADTMGKEYVNVSEEYTTKGCPRCLTVTEIGSSKTFKCCNCQYTAPRDIKSGLTLAIKCLKAP